MNIAVCPRCKSVVELDATNRCRVCQSGAGLTKARLVKDGSDWARDVHEGTEALILAKQADTQVAAIREESAARCFACGALMPAAASFCPSCGKSVEDALADPANMQEAFVSLHRQVSGLRTEVAHLQKVVDSNAGLVDEISGRLGSSGVMSDQFWTRAFAIYGHMLAAAIPIAIAVALVAALVRTQ